MHFIGTIYQFYWKTEFDIGVNRLAGFKLRHAAEKLVLDKTACEMLLPTSVCISLSISSESGYMSRMNNLSDFWGLRKGLLSCAAVNDEAISPPFHEHHVKKTHYKQICRVHEHQRGHLFLFG